MVNGQTGKVTGDRPYSWWKILGCLGLLFLIFLILLPIGL